MKFYGNIHHHLKTEKSDNHHGLLSVNCNLCKPNGRDLGSYMVSMIFSAMEFSEDCGIDIEEATEALNYLRDRLSTIEFQEVK